MTAIADDELLRLSEFGLLAENAEQAGVTGPLPPVRRVEAGGISALQWGEESPRVVFLHGGGQNAHTWDTVVVGLGVPALAVDLPGHGHSAWREDGDYSPQNNAAAIAPVIDGLAPEAELVVGMSLGGLTAIGLGAIAPQLVRELVLIDVTPSAMKRVSDMTKEQQGTVALLQGEREFPSFESILAITTAAAPHRDRKSLRRGVFHNTRQLDNGNWTWRWDTIREFPDFDRLWDDVSGLSVPVRLVRGGESPFVTDEDAHELAGRAQQFQGVRTVQNSGHSVQSDQPLVLTEILRGVLAGESPPAPTVGA
ncbi:alpha/beta hydrolase [Mycobacterium sp.]|uniref:alpha/beta fold hydrolase n=1 Tax=Mycobacterium sp. TaxID=1785 RepID=UPI0031D0100F